MPKWLDNLLNKIYYLPKEWRPVSGNFPTRKTAETKQPPSVVDSGARLPDDVDEMYATIDKYAEEASAEDAKTKPKKRKTRATKKKPVRRTITKRRNKRAEGSHGE